MKLKIDFDFIHYAMIALAGHRFWFLPLLALVWIMFQYFLRVRNGVEIINLLTIQYTIIGLPLTVLAIFFGVRVIAGELDERSLEIAYTIPGGSERLWLAKLFSAFLEFPFFLNLSAFFSKRLPERTKLCPSLNLETFPSPASLPPLEPPSEPAQ